MHCRKVKNLDIILIPKVFQAIHSCGILRGDLKGALTETLSFDSHKCVWMDFHQLLAQSHILQEQLKGPLHRCSCRHVNALHIALPIH